MVKICHVTSVHKNADVRIFVKECSSLAKNPNYKVYLVAQGEGYVKNNVNVIGVGDPPQSRLKRMVKFSKKVYEAALRVDADVYHLHDPELIPWGLKLKKKGKKVIFDSHERYTEQIMCKDYLPKPALKFISDGYGAYEKYALRRFDAVIFPCTIGGKNPFKGLCRRTAIIGNPVVLSEFYDLYDPNAEKDENSICYIGALTEDRGITNDVLAASKAGVKLLLAGEFSPESYGDQLKKMPEYSCVEHLGFLDRDEVRMLMQRSKIGMFTLRDRGQYFKIDTFGIKVYEYMSMGLPVVLSDCDYNRKMVEKYKFGICVDPDNIDQVAKAIRRILDNPELAKQMGENGRKAVACRFNWGVDEKRLFKLYESVLK